MGEIRYPWETPPENGELREIADDVYWLRLPLPMKLDHVNIYVLNDGDGWTLIDTGMNWGKGRVKAMWQALLDGPLAGKPINRVIATHAHPDHIGFHGWFVDQHGAEHVSTQVAYLMGRMLTLDKQDSYTPRQLDFYRRAGMRADLFAARQTDRPFNFADMVDPIPIGYTRIDQGQTIQMAGRTWDIHIGHGHSPHHATFWSRDDNLVLTGDQVIPSISSNIGIYPTEPDADPLGEWLESCARFRDLSNDTQLALPGHKVPFTGMPLRLTQLLENHESALNRLRDDLKTPKSAGDVMPTIFKRALGDGEYGLGLVEALAHCNHLWHRGEATRILSDDGKYLWQMA